MSAVKELTGLAQFFQQYMRKRQTGNKGEVHCVSTSSSSAKEVADKSENLNLKMGVSFEVSAHPESDYKDNLHYRKVLQKIDNPTCAIIAVPDHLHYQVAKDCLDAGLHVLLVKPLTPTYDEGKKLVDLADKYSFMEQNSIKDGIGLI